MSSPDTTARFDTGAGVRAYAQDRLAEFEPAGEPTRLPEGNLNVVWRVPGMDRSVILKYAPPHIAVDPDTPLDPSRLTIEARCLKALGAEGWLSDVVRPTARAPRLLDVQEEPHVLLMEDCGPVPTLGRWLRSADPDAVRARAPDVGRWLGGFIGRLHRRTLDDANCATEFDNRSMQETRLSVQYRAVADMLRAGGVDDADALGERAAALGEDLLSPGQCLTMGDLWPPSVLVGGDGVRIIDWELAQYGRPFQDLAHWEAHLWMQRHRAPGAERAEAVEGLRQGFRTAYHDALGAAHGALWDAAERRAAAVHFGAELLVRAVGAFQAGYLYEGLAPDHAAVQEAVTTAARHLRAPEATDRFAA
jgi:5-methylthioribose kinase